MQPMFVFLLLALISVCTAHKHGPGGGPMAAIEMMGCGEYAKAVKTMAKGEEYKGKFKACKEMPEQEVMKCVIDTGFEVVDKIQEVPSPECWANAKRLLKMP